MKKNHVTLITFVACLLVASLVTGALTNGSAQYLNSSYRGSGSKTLDPIYLNMVETEAQLMKSQVSVTKSANYTAVDPNDVGRIIYVDTDAVVITLPAVGTGETYTIMNIADDGTAAIHVDVNGSDKVLGGCGFVALDDGDKLTNTKATAVNGDYVTYGYGSAAGWYITAMRGTWADGG